MPDSRFPVYSFRLRVVTPLFLGGADPDVRAELRPPSIKGALRDWYRVLAGIEQAAANEARLFGGATGGAGQSPFLLAIDPPLAGVERWRRPRAGRDGISGLGYLGYSLDLGDNDRKYILPGEAFTLEAAFPRGADDDSRRALLATVWLLAHLGGLGTRSRRGFGSLSLEDVRGPEGAADLGRLPLVASAAGAADAAGSLDLGLKTVSEWLSAGDPPSPAPSRPLGFRLAGARLVVIRGPDRAGAWASARDALEHTGAAMQRFRRRRGLDGFPTAQMLAAGERLPRAPARAAFGLPLAYRNRRGGTHNLEPYLPGDKKRSSQEYRRFPSPLLIHVQQIRGGFVPVVTLLAGAWPGRDVPVHVRGQGCPEDPENRAPAAFLDHLVADGAMEVRR